jgi:hypothetical protein
MLGGEPLVSDFHDEIVELLIKSNRSLDISLHYNTNLQIDAERKLEVWSKFKKIDLSISIDGYGDTYEYIRWPGKWDKLSNNIDLVLKYSKENKNIVPNIATTVQNLNIDNLDQLINNINNLSNEKLSFYFIPVVHFNELEIIPKQVLEESYIRLEQFKNTKLYRINELLNMILFAIKKSDSIDDSKVYQFFKMQQQYDSIRKQNLFELKPHFKKYAEKYGISIW